MLRESGCLIQTLLPPYTGRETPERNAFALGFSSGKGEEGTLFLKVAGKIHWVNLHQSVSHAGTQWVLSCTYKVESILSAWFLNASY